jgi:hypothetical protein
MDEASSLSSATSRLERRDGTLTSIDIRGAFAFGSCARRSTVRRFVAALRHSHRRGHPQEARCHDVAPPSSAIISTDPPGASRPWCSLRSVSLHNRLLEKSELPHLVGALPLVPTLEVLVIFNHDVGDDGAMMLMECLTGSASKIADGVDGGSGRSGDAPPARAFADMSMTTTTTTTTRTTRTTTTTQISMTHPKSCGLRELYLSHCGIGCRGARAIAAALDDSRACDGGDDDGRDIDDDNRLKCLQVLSLGSNLIEWEGATPLAIAFGTFAPLQRLVLNGNRGLNVFDRHPRTGHPIANEHQRGERHRRERSMIRRAFVATGWGCPRPPHSIPPSGDSDAPASRRAAAKSAPVSERAMSEIFVPLVLRYVTRRWEEDRVLIRPHDVLRARLREATLTPGGGGYAEYVDEHADCVPDVLSYLGRVGACCKQTSLHSSPCSVNWARESRTIVSHSTGWEICRACSAVHLGDLYDLLKHIPHLVATLRDTVRLPIEGKGKS